MNIFAIVPHDITLSIISFLNSSTVQILRHVIRLNDTLHGTMHNTVDNTLSHRHFIGMSKELILWAILNRCPMFDDAINYLVTTKNIKSLVCISTMDYYYNKIILNTMVRHAMYKTIRICNARRFILLHKIFNIVIDVRDYVNTIAQHGSIRLLTYLYIHMQIDHHLITLHLVTYERTECMKNWITFLEKNKVPLDKNNHRLCTIAAENNDLKSLAFLRGVGFKCTYKALYISLYGKQSNFECVKYLYNKGYIRYERYNKYYVCYCHDCVTCLNSYSDSQLGEYSGYGYQFQSHTFATTLRISEITISPTSKHEDSECINYRRKLKHYKKMSELIGSSSVECIEYLHEYSYECIMPDIYITSIKNNDIKHIEYLKSLNFPMVDSETLKYIMMTDYIHLDTIKCLYELGCPLFPDIGKRALYDGRYNLLNYILDTLINKTDSDFDSDFDPYSHLIDECGDVMHLNMYLECIKCLHNHGYPVPLFVIQYALRNNVTNLVILLHTLGYQC
jgi:hypothetical protein